MTQQLPANENQVDAGLSRKNHTYDIWMHSQGIPVHGGFYIEDLRTVELGWWKARECNAAFIQLDGKKGVTETRVSEIPPGATLPPIKQGFDELVYVLSGHGITSVWTDESDRKSFEWAPRSLFMVPRHHHHQFSNTRGDTPVRLMHFSYLPVAMSASNSPNFFFNNPYVDPDRPQGEIYSEAKAVKVSDTTEGDPYLWYGNFFPDMGAWDRLSTYQRRGGGGHHLSIQFPHSEMSCHMSVFPDRTYKKGHRHGPGRAIVIPAGEGYSILWQEGQEKIVVPWHEASLFTPPDRWFHQHFNVGRVPARYLALHPLSQFSGHSERVEDASRDQIEYPNEDPWIRQKFEEELAKRGLTSLMPDEAYRDINYKWSFRDKYAEPVA